MAVENMKMLHDCRWSNPATYNLGSTEKLVFQWLLGNERSSLSGVYTVMTGAIQDGVGYHNFDNNVKGSPVYPALDKLVESEAIDYDKKTHTVRIIDYHKFRPFGNGNPSVVLKSLEKNIKALHNKSFFVEYIFENYDIITKKVQQAKLGDNEKGELTNLLQAIDKASKTKKPDSEITAKKTSALLEEVTVAQQLS